jgi:hypothetical protein
MNRRLSAIAVILIALFLSACTTLPAIKPDPANSIKTIAVLPLVNNTNDVDGPFVVRTLLAARLGGYFYTVKSLEETDLILKDQMGVTLGSQLEMATSDQLCEKLNIDAIIHGSLEDFSQKITGIYNSKRVRMRLKLESCKTGAGVWKNGVGVKREVLASDNMLKNVPMLGKAITTVGVVSSVISSMSDKGNSDLPKFRNEEIKAPWQDISEDNSTAELNIVFGIGEKIVNKAMSSALLTETATAVEILLHGYYDDGNDFIPYGTMIPPGPATLPVTTATK